ncbi:translation elongation factor Ts [Candidatus Peregrinibacteria bacterium]|nr:translation elongation factor Ts [Candidatus Peregrinibacteria bacterium]
MSAQAVVSLRQRTGVSISACKEALDEAKGDEEKAIEILRKRGIAQAAKKAVREQKEGFMFSAEDQKISALVLLHCETDFVARDAGFQTLGKDLVQALLKEGEARLNALANERLPDAVQKLGENISLGEHHRIEAPVKGTYIHTNGKIGVIIGLDSGTEEQARSTAMHAAAMNPQYVSPDDVPSESIEKEKEIWREQLAKEGKPAQIMDKIMMGKEKKFREENALLKQEFVKEPGKTVEQYLGKAKVLSYVRVEIS